MIGRGRRWNVFLSLRWLYGHLPLWVFLWLLLVRWVQYFGRMLLNVFGRWWRGNVASIYVSGWLLIYPWWFFLLIILLLLECRSLSWGRWWWSTLLFLLHKCRLHILFPKCWWRRRWHISPCLLRKLLEFGFGLGLVECCYSRRHLWLFLVWLDICGDLLRILRGCWVFVRCFFSFLLSFVHHGQVHNWSGMVPVLSELLSVVD